jgi:hypothetical protein
MRSANDRLVATAAAMLHQRHYLTLGPDDPDLPLTKLERRAREKMDEFSQLVIRRIVVVTPGEEHAGPSPEEKLALLEKEVAVALDKLNELVSALRASLLPQKKRKVTLKNPNR